MVGSMWELIPQLTIGYRLRADASVLVHEPCVERMRQQVLELSDGS